MSAAVIVLRNVAQLAAAFYRECDVCNGDDDALDAGALARSDERERALILQLASTPATTLDEFATKAEVLVTLVQIGVKWDDNRDMALAEGLRADLTIMGR